MAKTLYAGAALFAAAVGAGLVGGCAEDDVAVPPPPGNEPTCTAEQLVDPGPSPVRRLTRHEYNNTVRDLLGDATSPASDWIEDGVTLGFDNNAASQQVTETHAKQMFNTALAVADRAVTDLAGLLPCDLSSDGESECADKFIREFATRAFRRPLADDEIARLRALFDAGALSRADFPKGIRMVVAAVLQSPHFLYRIELGMPGSEQSDRVHLSDHEIASRLSYLLWGSMPDAPLIAAADGGELNTAEQIRSQAERMLTDPRAADALDHFHRQWLLLTEMDGVSKDPNTYPELTEDVRTSMVDGSLAFARHVVLASEQGDFKELLSAPYGFANEDTAPLLGADVIGTEQQRVELDPTQRAGIVTDLSLLTTTALYAESSPVRRGVFVREHLLCQPLPAPPDDVELTIPEINPDMTTRERYAAHTEEPSCAGCHKLIDGIGFGFEGYDAIGRYRTTENGLAVDQSGEVVGTDDVDGTFVGAVELARKLADSSEARECLVRNWFRFAHGRSESDDDACVIASLDATFVDADLRIRDLIIALTQTEAFRYRRPFASETINCEP